MRQWGAMVFLTAVTFSPVRAVPPEEADRIVRDAVARAPNIPGQVSELLQLAWFQKPLDPAVSASAQRSLAEYGRVSLQPLALAIDRVRPEQLVEVVRVLMAASDNAGPGAQGYPTALTDVLWSRERAAKKLVIPELARYRFTPAVLPLIDSAKDDPELLPDVVTALGAIGDVRARFFLDRVLNEPDPALRQSAAASLARIGGVALEPLRNAMRSTSRELRLAAVRALLPVSSEQDLTAFYDYLSAHPDDDPATVQAVRSTAEHFEKVLADKQAAEAASPPKEF